MSARSILCLILPLAASVGCGESPKTFPVQGMVVFPDGTPLTRGTVEFESMDHSPAITGIGEVQANGAFQLGTYDVKDGAVPGRHQVAIMTDSTAGPREERPEKLPAEVIPERYHNARTSGLEFKVEPGSNWFLIEILPLEQPSPG